MQKNAQVEKKKVYWDGEEIPGLIKVEEIKFENKTVDVADFAEEHTIDSNIKKIPPVVMTYRCDVGTKTLEFFEDFHNKQQTKQGLMVRTDAVGNPIRNYHLIDCNCFVHNIPPFDSGSPQAASITVTVNPWDIVPFAVS
jgi:hypothetical protein